MLAFRALFERIRVTPPRRLPARVFQVAMGRARYGRRRRADKRQPTTLSNAQFARTIRTEDQESAEDLSTNWPSVLGRSSLKEGLGGRRLNGTDGLQEVAERARAHRFDLLGSGWTCVGYETASPGAFGHQYFMNPDASAEAEQLAFMRRLLDEAAIHVGDESPELASLRGDLDGENYRPIDWHLDFKSGYRWDPNAWHMDVSIGTQDGVDIKVPWELSRGHHLVTLALDATFRQESVHENAREISLQLLDWIAANPPRFGVNWRTTMEVGIRASNWVWALSILGDTPSIPPAIRWLVAKSLYQHGIHITNHLEYQADYTSNHYLANIVGLMHIGSAYPEFKESAGWIDFCLEQLVSEMRRTVFPDGVNYECSTGYHRLVTEMFLHGALLTLRLTDEQRSMIASLKRRMVRATDHQHDSGRREFDLTKDAVLPNWFWLRLHRMLGYVEDVTKPNGLALQFGDQDSGRFLKLSWIGRTSGSEDLVEEFRDHRHLLAVGARLFGHSGWEEAGQTYELDGLVTTYGVEVPSLLEEQEAPDGRCHFVSTEQPGAPESFWYPFGGTMVMKRGPFWAGVRCVPGGSKGPSGHRHNDQLSFELSVDGEDVIVDWGTGIYTADSEVRNRFRSTANHSTAYPNGQEQNRLIPGREGVFVLRDTTAARCIGVEAAKFVGEHSGYGKVHQRSVTLLENAIVIEDSLNVSGGFCISLTMAEGVTPVVRKSNVDGSTVDLFNGGIVIQIDSTAVDTTIERGLLSRGYGMLQDAWLLGYSVDQDSSRLTLRNPSRGDP